MEKLGLIAGNGTFPLLFAREARRRGLEIVAVAHRGETSEELEHEVAALTWVRVGQLGKMISVFRRAGIKRAVMAGGINKVRSLSALRPDFRGMLFLRRVAGMGDDSVLKSLAAEFEGRGIDIVPSTLFLERILASPGLIAGPAPEASACDDIKLGMRVLAALGPLDVGQSVVLERGLVLAVEAIEGTDAAIRRAGELGRGGATVVKAAKPGQDMRFDVPAVGPGTIESMVAAGAKTLAVQAGATIVLDDECFAETAVAHGISCVGIDENGEIESV